MDLFVSLALLLALAILLSAWQRDKISDPALYRKAVQFFVIAIVLHNPVMEFVGLIPRAGFVLAVTARIVGWIFLLVSFCALCRSWGAPLCGCADEQPPVQKP